MSKRRSAAVVMERPKVIGSYDIDCQVGKGAFGIVYKGFGEGRNVVAIKTFEHANIPQDEVAAIEAEIKLLQKLNKLNHPNIVKYVDMIKDEHTMNIVLEYAEFGSLQSLMKRFGGSFPEALVSIYAAQVLAGLDFLHEQGVIHRDIKSANILIQQDGYVKLADFGVATNAEKNALKSDSVVGTPYWMAPEIIEMTGSQSTACDIWSLGCTVVELLSGTPPYFELDPMPALFRIVQDEHPPLPPGISDACEDFLLLCFQKDPHLRNSAADLLKHAWIRHSPNDRTERILAHFSDEVRKQQLFIDLINVSVDTHEIVSLANASKYMTIKGMKAVQYRSSVSEDEVSSEDPFSGISEDGVEEMDRVAVNLGKFQDSDEEGDIHVTKIDFSKLDSSKPWDSGNDVEEDDFDPFEGQMFNDDLELQVDEEAKVADEIELFMNDLNPTAEDHNKTKKAIQKLHTLLDDYKAAFNTQIDEVGVIPFLEMIEVHDEEVLLGVVRLMLDIMRINTKFMQSLCLVGLVPAMVKLIKERYSYDTRIEASHIIYEICTVDDKESHEFIKRIFVASGGLQALVALVDQRNYDTYKDLVMTGVNCIELIMDTQSSHKRDFCRLLCKAGMVKPLIKAMLNLHKDNSSPKAAEYVKRIAKIIFVFVANGKTVVRTYLATRVALEALMQMLDADDHSIKVLILKTFQVLSAEVNIRDKLEKVGIIPKLMEFYCSPHPDIDAQVLPMTLNLFKIKLSRQEQLAFSGAIPLLQSYVNSNHHAKSIPIQILCELAQTSREVRRELKKYNGVQMYIELLRYAFWKARALEALAVWISDDCQRVESILFQNHNLHQIVMVMKNADKTDFAALLRPLGKIISVSSKLNEALGRSGTFMSVFVQRLRTNKAKVQKPMLTLLKDLLSSVHEKKSFGSKHGLLEVLKTLSKDGRFVLVQDLAVELLEILSS